MKLDAGLGKRRRPVRLAVPPQIAEQIRHGSRLEHLWRSEGEAADGAQLLLELTGPAGVKCQVSGVVRTRRQLVDQQAAILRDEELHAHQTDVVEPFHHLPRHVDRQSSDAWRHVGGSDGDIENVTAVRVLDRPEVRPRAIDAARTDDRDLPIEIDERLEDGFAAAQRIPGGRNLVRSRDRDLALAVVAKRRRLENGWTSHLLHG